MSRNYSSIAEPKTLAGDVLLAATQITLNNITDLPSPPYVLVLNPDTASEEVILVNANQSDVISPTLKVTRAIETGATAKDHTHGDIVRHMIVGSDLQLAHDHIDLTAAHGATGAVVGTTNTQTLTSKTLTAPKINENVTLTATSTELNVLDGITASTAELNYTDGVTSAIQTQINTKAPSADPTFTGTVVLPSTTSIGTVSSTELGYVDGVTSAIQTQIDTIVNTTIPNATPVGTIVMYGGIDAPTGWLLCNGQSTASYTALAAVVGPNVPDLMGRAPIGYGTSADAGITARTTISAKTGTEEVTLDVTQIPSHNHSISPAMIVGTGSGAVNNYAPTGNNPQTAVTITNTGGGLPHPNMQPSTVVNFIIKH